MKQRYTVQRGALDGVEAFLRVAERRSFRAAAADLGVTPSAVSQAVRALEARVGIALFTRTTRSVGLTEAGERFRERAQPAFQEIIAASSAASTLGAKPSGLLRLAVPRAVVPVLLRPLLASFCAAYPEVSVEIAASEELVDLARDGFDAGIRLGELVASATKEGYKVGGGRAPFHGYYYKILTKQGAKAQGGELDYVVRGKMIGGFALVAYPAEYRNSGVMTFLVNHNGTIYQRDLGPNTAQIAERMTAYEPDPSWQKVDTKDLQ